MFEEEGNDSAALSVDEKQAEVDPRLMEEMAKAGVLYGRKKTKTHPRMKRYIHMTRSGVEILDITQTAGLITAAREFLKEIARAKSAILFVGTTPAAKDLVESLAKKFGYPFVNERWLGGTLTNFKTIKERLNYYLKLKADRGAGRLEKYTKKERLDFDKEIARMTHLFGGLERFTDLPRAIVVVGGTSHPTALREAKRMKIPVVAIISSDADPDHIDYPIVANDRARSSIAWVLAQLESALVEANGESQPTQSGPDEKNGN